MATNDIYELVDKFYIELANKMDGVMTNKTVKRPDIIIKDRKTFIINFNNVCTSIDREQQHAADYIAKQLNVPTSITANEELIVHGVCHKQKLEELIKRYVHVFVKCPNCNSCSTQLNKVNRITYINCTKCKAHAAIKL